MYLGYRTIQLWCCVSFFGVSVFGSGDYDRKKKVPVLRLAGCVTTGKKSSSRRQSNYDRKKKDTIVNIQFVLVQLELKLIQIR